MSKMSRQEKRRLKREAEAALDAQTKKDTAIIQRPKDMVDRMLEVAGLPSFRGGQRIPSTEGRPWQDWMGGWDRSSQQGVWRGNQFYTWEDYRAKFGDTKVNYYPSSNVPVHTPTLPFTGGFVPNSSSSNGQKHVTKDGETVFYCEESKEITEKCPIMTVPRIYIPEAMWDIFCRLCKKISTEWIALLKGRFVEASGNEKAYYEVTGYYFPPQTASGAHVEVPTSFVPKPGTIGAIHSHVRMNAFFSATDKAHSNWPIEIVLNAYEKYEAICRHKLKCGEWAKSDCDVYLSEKDNIPSSVEKAITIAFESGRRWTPATHSPSPTPAIPSPAPSIPTTTEPPKPTIPPTIASEDAEDVMDAMGVVGEGGVLSLYHRDGTVGDTPLDEQEDDEDWREDLPEEEYCQVCEGYGTTIAVIAGRTDEVKCEACSGDGLSPIGKIRAKERDDRKAAADTLAAQSNSAKDVPKSEAGKGQVN